MRFRILGSVEVFDGDGWRGVGAAKWRALCAILLINAGQVVPVDRISAELWGDQLPRSAGNLVHGYVARLRGLLNDRRGQVLKTRHPGYQLVVDLEDIDAHHFGSLVAVARDIRRKGDASQAAAHLTEALALWRGPALADVPATPLVQNEVARLEEQRLAALEARIDADLACGRHATLIPELNILAEEHPLREQLWGQLILALYRCGRQAEALATHRRVKQQLADELGIDPSPGLQRLERAVLRQDPVLDETTTLAEVPERRQHETVDKSLHVASIPAQLPPDLSTFVGRAAELTILHSLSTAARSRPPGAVTIVSIDGMAGVGKTALAVHAAHQLAEHYPDGQIFVDLHGYTEGLDPAEPADVLEQMLRALDVATEHIPAQEGARAALYRTHLAGKRMLVLLDNAHSEAQVRPLLPASSASLVLITSRRRLADLDDVHPISLDVFSRQDATILLTQATSAARLHVEPPERITEVVELCGRLPLAVRIAAARLRHRPNWTLAGFAERLRDRQARLTELRTGQRGVPGAIDMSYHDLEPDQRRMFRLLGLHPGPDIDTHAAAALGNITVRDAERLLETLLDTHLVLHHLPHRFRFHDLIRVRAAQICREQEPEPDRRIAVTRLFDHYMHTASTAMDVVYPHESDYRPQTSAPRSAAHSFADEAQAVAWLDIELANLLAVAKRAAHITQWAHVSNLSAILQRHLRTRGHYSVAKNLQLDALRAARKTGDRAGEISALNGLGDAHRLQGAYDDAMECHQQALDLARGLGDRFAQLAALRGLSFVHRMQTRYERAATCNQEALILARTLGDHVGERSALNGIGEIHRMQGQYGLAAECFQQAMDVARANGDSLGEHDALRGLGAVHRLLGQYQSAGDCYQKALAIARATGDPGGEQNALWGVGAVYHLQGRHEAATGCYQQALSLAREIGDRNGQIESLNGLGRTCHSTGQAVQAAKYHTAALELAMELGQREDQACAHNGLAHAHYSLGRFFQALQHWRHTLEILTEFGLTQIEDVRADDVRARLAALPYSGRLAALQD